MKLGLFNINMGPRSVPEALAEAAVAAEAAGFESVWAGEHGPVLHRPDGHPLDRRRFSDSWRATMKAAGLADVRFHDCRHTFASTLLSAGVSIKAVAEWLGHASPTVTLRTYAHLMPVDDDRARGVLDAAFNPAGDFLGTGSPGLDPNALLRAGVR